MIGGSLGGDADGRHGAEVVRCRAKPVCRQEKADHAGAIVGHLSDGTRQVDDSNGHILRGAVTVAKWPRDRNMWTSMLACIASTTAPWPQIEVELKRLM